MLTAINKSITPRPENDAFNNWFVDEFKIVEDEEYTKLTANFVALDIMVHIDQSKHFLN